MILHIQLLLMYNEVLCRLLEEIRDANFFSTIADEATDVSHNEQISISMTMITTFMNTHFVWCN